MIGNDEAIRHAVVGQPRRRERIGREPDRLGCATGDGDSRRRDSRSCHGRGCRGDSRRRRGRGQARQLPLELRPAGQCTHALEIVARRGVGRHAKPRQAIEHDEGIAGPSAQALRPRQHPHEIRIVARPLLHGSPRQIVKRLIVVSIGRLERLLTALLPGAALSRGALIEYRRATVRRRSGRSHRAGGQTDDECE